jgi:hypothetical protein
MEREICNECGKSVQSGSGLYVNRIPDFNEYVHRVEMQKPFPEGDFICSRCNEELNQKIDVGNKRIAD